MIKTLIADSVGLISLAVLTLLIAMFFPKPQLSAIEWLFAYLMVAAASLFVWHHGNSPKAPQTWIILALCAVPIAMVWAGYSRLAAGAFFWSGEPSGSKEFDFAITALLSPGLTAVAVIGGVRAMIVRKYAN